MSQSVPSDVRACPVFTSAHSLAEWIGAGREVTPGGALKSALVPEAAASVGLPHPARVRRSADLPGFHRVWVTALASDLIALSGRRAVRTETQVAPAQDVWFTALEQVVREQVRDPCGADPRILCQVTLTMLSTDPAPGDGELRDSVEEVMRQRGDWSWMAYLADGVKQHPVDTVVEILRDFGALDARLGVTPLGSYARSEFGRRVPPPITPGLPAAELLRLLAALPEEEIWEPVRRWRLSGHADNDRDPLRELLHAAADAPAAGRSSAIDVIGERGSYSTALWRETTRHPTLGPYARLALADLDAGPRPARQDLHWVATDRALAALDRYGITDAWYVLLDGIDGDVHDGVRGSDHPEAYRLLQALPSAPPPIPACQLKISLYPGLWRRVLVPENLSLGALHEVLVALFGWSDDHLHLFETSRRRYADPFHGLEECGDEYSYRLNRALPAPRSKISYTYDLGDCWRHEIMLEKLLADGVAHPVCVGGRGDNPIEDYNPEYPDESVPFEQDAINRRLTARFDPAADG